MTFVALTGGTGLIGSHVAEAFTSMGIRLRAVVRPGSDLTFLSELGVELALGDITDPVSLERAFEGASFVIHTAGKVSDWGRAEEFEAINVQGTRQVLRAAAKAGVRDVIVTGSISSYGEEHCETPKDESFPFSPRYDYFAESWFPSGMNRYRCSKAEATQAAMEEARETGVNLTVLEPVFVFGEREFHSGFYSYLEEARRGTPFLPGRPDSLFHVIYARDLAQAYVKAYEKRLPGVHRFIVGNPEVDTMEHVFGLFCRLAGLKKPPRAPKWALYPIGFFLEALYTLVNASHPPTLTRARVNMFYDSICYDVSRAERLLGFRASTPLEEAMTRTVAWYKAGGYL